MHRYEDQREHRFVSREQEPKPDHEQRQADVVKPEMETGQARGRSRWIEVIHQPSEREGRPSKEQHVCVDGHESKLLTETHCKAEQCADDQINDGNLDEAQAHGYSPCN